ncbi:MAG: aspartate-semialdehyde dehydrogenase [Pseudomonadota bacterium]
MAFTDLKFAIVGATGAVGRTLLSILAERGVPKENITAIASERSLGIKISYGHLDELKIKALNTFDFSTTHIAFFSAGGDISAKYAPIAAAQGALVIDKSSRFRMDADVPLVVPEVNMDAIALAAKRRIIANPNCSTIQLVVALKPVHDVSPIKRVVLSTYQAVSGAGQKAMDILFNETKTVLMNQPSTANKLFPKPIAFNVIPKIDDFAADGSTKEELKMIEETKKILSADMTVAATCVRVPVFIGHSISVNVECTTAFDLKEMQVALKASKAIKMPKTADQFFTSVEIAQDDEVFVSRLRKDTSVPHGLSFWVVADNLRKGAALNGVQIAEAVYKHHKKLLRK